MMNQKKIILKGNTYWESLTKKIHRMRMMNEMNEVCQKMEGEIQNLTLKVKETTTEVLIFEEL